MPANAQDLLARLRRRRRKLDETIRLYEAKNRPPADGSINLAETPEFAIEEATKNANN